MQQYQRSIFIINIFIILVCFKYSNAQGGNGLYSRRYEKLDVDTILNNPRLVTNYVDCLLNKRPCPPEGKDLKRILPEALRTKCGRCWPSQKEGALKVITKLYYDYPEHYAALREKWDPTGEYHRRFEEYLRDQNFNLITNDEDRDVPIVLQPTSFTTTTSTTQSPPPPLPSIPSSGRPEIQPSRNSILTQTERPIRGDFNEVQPQPKPQAQPQETQDVFIANRFADSENEFNDMTMKVQPPRTPAPTPRQTQVVTAAIPLTTRITYMAQPTQYGGTATVTVFKTQNPILNFINRLTTKFATTAEILAGMLRGNVQINTNMAANAAVV